MSGIAIQQVRLATNPGIEGDGAGNVVGAVRVKAAGGLTRTGAGVIINPAGSVTHTGGGRTFNGAATLSVIGASFTANEVPNADWVTSQIATGISWSYPVLAGVQLGSTTIRQAIAVYFTAQPTAADTFILEDGTATDTFTAVAGAAGANQFSLDTDADAAMTSLAAAITADSTLWNATVVTALQSINPGGGSTAGRVLIIYRIIQLDAKVDRVYGVWAQAGDCQIVNFNGENDYTKSTSINIPAVDPAAKAFGPGKILLSLSAGEAHVELDGDSQYVWDEDGDAWVQISGTGSITAGTGLAKVGSAIHIGATGTTGNVNGISRTANDIGVATGGGLEVVSDLVRISAAAAGDGLTGGAGSALAVNTGTGLEINTDTVRISAAAAGVGLSGGAGVALLVNGENFAMKEPVRVRTTVNAPLTPGSSLSAVDGVTLAVGSRVLIGEVEQTTDSESGIYEVTTQGAGDTSTWVRTSDAPVGGAASGWYIHVIDGATHGDTLFRVGDAFGDSTIGTFGWAFTSFSGADTTRAAGAGLVDGAGLDLDVNTGDGITVDTDRVVAQVATASAGQQYGGLVRNVNASGAGAGAANAGYLAIQTDASTLGVNSSNQISVTAGGITETHLNTSVAGGGLAGGGGTVLSVGVENGLAVSANAVGIDLTGGNGAISYSGTTSHTYPVGTTAVGLFATGTPTDANHVVNKTYVDNNVSGLVWQEPVVCIDFHGNQTYAQLEALTPGHSDSYVATTAGTLTLGTLAVVAGDVVEYDGAAWIKLVSGSGGFVATGTRLVLIADGDALVGPYTDPGDRGKIAVFDGTSLTGVLTTASTNDAVLVVGVAGESQPVDDNRAYVNEGGAGGSASWLQFSGGGTTNAGTGMTLSGNTLNVNATAVTNTNPTILAQTDSIEVKYNSSAGLTDTASGLEMKVDIASTVATSANAVLVSSNGVNVAVDNATIEGSLQGGAGAETLRVKPLGINTAQLTALGVTIAKLGIKFETQDITAAGFSSANPSVQTGTLTNGALVDANGYGFVELFRNGVADMNKNGTGTAMSGTGADEYKVQAGGTKIEIGADISASGNTYRARYLSLLA